MRRETLHLATGLLLPVWDKLPDEQVQVIRIAADDGRSLLGREIPAASLAELGAKLGLDVSLDLPPDELAATVLRTGKPLPFRGVEDAHPEALAGQRQPAPRACRLRARAPLLVQGAGLFHRDHPLPDPAVRARRSGGRSARSARASQAGTDGSLVVHQFSSNDPSNRLEVPMTDLSRRRLHVAAGEDGNTSPSGRYGTQRKIEVEAPVAEARNVIKACSSSIVTQPLSKLIRPSAMSSDHMRLA